MSEIKTGLQEVIDSAFKAGVNTGHSQIMQLISELVNKPDFGSMTKIQALQLLVENVKALNIIEAS